MIKFDFTTAMRLDQGCTYPRFLPIALIVASQEIYKVVFHVTGSKPKKVCIPPLSLGARCGYAPQQLFLARQAF